MIDETKKISASGYSGGTADLINLLLKVDLTYTDLEAYAESVDGISAVMGIVGIQSEVIGSELVLSILPNSPKFMSLLFSNSLLGESMMNIESIYNIVVSNVSIAEAFIGSATSLKIIGTQTWIRCLSSETYCNAVSTNAMAIDRIFSVMENRSLAWIHGGDALVNALLRDNLVSRAYITENYSIYKKTPSKSGWLNISPDFTKHYVITAETIGRSAHIGNPVDQGNIALGSREVADIMKRFTDIGVLLAHVSYPVTVCYIPMG